MTDPVLAIIIPVFRHSVLMVDAVESALAQRGGVPIRIVIVNDGCPHPETHETGLAYARAWPDRVTYLRKENGGLSSARNHGIAHVLAHWPSVRALYMLDADNALRPDAMARALAALDADPQAGWIYPDIDMVGLASGHDYSGPYSVLLHTAMNTCEAGSLIRRAVFDAGVLFDTSFKAGFEDWDFFLTAVEAGFRGKNIEGFGFLYRKRPESMLADSERERDPILARLRAKHRALFSPRALLELEQAEAPRYAFYLSDLQEVWLTTDPLVPAQVLTPEDFTHRAWAALSAPGRHVLPPLTVVTTTEALGELASSAMLHGLLWQLETMLDQAHVAGLMASNTAEDRLGVALLPEGHRMAEEAGVLMLTTALLTSPDAMGTWLDTLLTPRAQPRLLMAEASLPPGLSTEAMARGGAGAALCQLVERLRQSRWRQGAVTLRDWREPDLKRRMDSHMILRNRLGRQPTLPLLRGEGRHMGLVLSILEFGGVEKVALNFARAFAARGWSVHLFVLGRRSGAVTEEWRQTLSSITFLADPEFSPWGGGEESYFGSEIPRWARSGNHARLIALLHWLDVVIDLHSGAAVAVMSQLKRQGVVTVTSLHLADLSPVGRPMGNPFLALAYEHAFDLFVPCSLALGDWLHAMGIPEDKIVPAPNAPSFDLPHPPARIAPQGRLRALFLGRLDAQKGLERLAEVMAQSRGLEVDWRVIGKAVLAEGAAPLPAVVARVLEPALTTPAELAQAFAEADVLVLLSEYEGLPLTVLEAMRQGVVPLATDVGAVAEVVRDGVNGVLLPLEDAVPRCLQALQDLARSPATLARLSQAASRSLQGRDWQAATAELSAALDLLCQRRVVTADTDIPPPAHVAALSNGFAGMERIDLTPEPWALMRQDGPSQTLRLPRYTPFAGLVQYGVPDGSDATVDVTCYPLRLPNGTTTHAVALKPAGRRQPWFTYELALPGIDLSPYVALDWTLRYAMERPRNLYAQFMLNAEGAQKTVDFGTLRSADVGTPMTLTLGLGQFPLTTLASLEQVRLVLSTDGDIVALDILDVAIHGRR